MGWPRGGCGERQRCRGCFGKGRSCPASGRAISVRDGGAWSHLVELPAPLSEWQSHRSHLASDGAARQVTAPPELLQRGTARPGVARRVTAQPRVAQGVTAPLELLW